MGSRTGEISELEAEMILRKAQEREKAKKILRAAKYPPGALPASPPRTSFSPLSANQSLTFWNIPKRRTSCYGYPKSVAVRRKAPGRKPFAAFGQSARYSAVPTRTMVAPSRAAMG